MTFLPGYNCSWNYTKACGAADEPCEAGFAVAREVVGARGRPHLALVSPAAEEVRVRRRGGVDAEAAAEGEETMAGILGIRRAVDDEGQVQRWQRFWPRAGYAPGRHHRFYFEVRLSVDTDARTNTSLKHGPVLQRHQGLPGCDHRRRIHGRR